MEKNSKIFVAGHKGLAGSALVRELKQQGYENLVTRSKEELNLLDTSGVEAFFQSEKPDYVMLAAAKVGGIHANSVYPADFIFGNLQVQNNVIHNSYLAGVKKLLFLGSSCIYPRLCPQPMKEEHLLTGSLEPTNEPYAIAKIAGIKMCQSYCRQYGTDFISVMPTNLYGINDNFHMENSHVLPALLRKVHEAKIAEKPSVEVWGTGSPKREFLYVDDMASACVFLMQNYSDPEIVNIGTGEEITIRELYETIVNVVGYKGDIVFDSSKPDGMPRKLLDVSKLHNLGWKHTTSLKNGVEKTYRWYVANEKSIRKE